MMPILDLRSLTSAFTFSVTAWGLMNTKAEFLGVSMVENVLDRAWAVKVKVNTLERTKSLFKLVPGSP